MFHSSSHSYFKTLFFFSRSKGAVARATAPSLSLLPFPLYVNDALGIRDIDAIGIEGVLDFRHDIVVDGIVIRLGNPGKGGDADGVLCKFTDTDFQGIGIEDPFIFLKDLFQQGNGFMVVILITDIEAKK